MIAVEGVACGYESPILHEITFTAEKDLCILGVNGIGKSTLAKALCGLIPSEGKIIVNGTGLQAFTPAMRARAITYIPPKLESFDDLITVYEFVLMGRYPYKDLFSSYSSADEALVTKLLEKSALEPDKYIGELSSGQQQLLLIAQALSQQSEIIIFDEPTANLDPRHAKDFYDALLALPDSTQKIVITHDLNLARQLGFELLFLEQHAARHYRDPAAFFQRENLEACYGVHFHIRDDVIGVAYD